MKNFISKINRALVAEKKLFLFLALLSSIVMLATPEPQVKLIDANTARIYWDSDGTNTTFKLVVSPEELTGNPDYWKGMLYLTDTFFTATNLTEDHVYYVYLQSVDNGVPQEWMSTSFTAREPYSPCDLIIEMRHDWGYNWGGDGFYIIDGDRSTFFTLKLYEPETKIYHASQQRVQMVWKSASGGWTEAYSFTITNGNGDVIVDVQSGDVYDYFYDEYIFYEDYVCPPDCPATLNNLVAIVDGTSFNLTWDADGADRFEVAVLQTAGPTNEEIEDAAVVVDQASYSFTGQLFAGYNVFVRPVCADGEKGRWENLWLQDKAEINDANIKAVAKPITLNYVQSGNLSEDGVLLEQENSDIIPSLVYYLELEDSTDVEFKMLTQFVGEELTIYQDTLPGAPLEKISQSTLLFPVRLKGKFYVTISAQGYAGDYTVLVREYKVLQPQEITLPFAASGDYSDAALGWESSMYNTQTFSKLYSITLPETTEVRFFWAMLEGNHTNPNTGAMEIIHYIYKDAWDSEHKIEAGPAGITTLELEANTTYFIETMVIPTNGGLPTFIDSLNLMLASDYVPEQLPAQTITLDFNETSDLTDGIEWRYFYSGQLCPTKVYALTATDSMVVQYYISSPDYNAQKRNMSVFGFENEINSDRCIVTDDMNQWGTIDVAKDSTYYFLIFTDPTLGGSADFTYTIDIKKMPEKTPVTLITPDVTIEDVTDDYIHELDVIGKVYEVVVTSDKIVRWSYEYLGEDPEAEMNTIMYVYQDQIVDGNDYAYFEWNYACYEYLYLYGSDEGTHYFFVVLSYQQPVPFRFVIREEPDYNHLPVNGELTVGSRNQSQLSILDGFTMQENSCSGSWNGSYEAYQVPLEKDKEYLVMMHKLAVTHESDYNGIGIRVFEPGLQQGSFDANVKYSECIIYTDNNWVILHMPSDSTVMDTIMFDSYYYSKYADGIIDYEFSVEEVIYLSDLVNAAPVVQDDELPLTEAGVFSDNAKVMPGTNGFHPDPYNTYVEEHGAYDALARNVLLNPGDTLFVEFGGDLDATIQFYDKQTLTLLKTVDDNLFSYPYEQGFIANDGEDPVEYAVVCSFNTVQLADAAWSMRMTKKQTELANLLVTPKADRESISIHESDGVAAAQTELGKLTLMAVDGADNIVATLTNNPFLWDIDLTNDVASYEFNNQDLPAGFVFENPTMFVVVAIERIPDLPTGFINTDFDENGTAYKILRDGQVYIIRDGMVYTIMGQRVR